MPLRKLLDKVRIYHKNDKLDLIEKAYDFAERAHEGQKRKSHEPYFEHPYRVALILADLRLDAETIAAGLLHDVIEDTKYVYKDIEAEFGVEVAMLVDGVSKLSRFDEDSKEQQKAESLRKMILAIAKDMRVVLIKLADRLHNMRTLKHMPPDKQLKISRETLDIYSPLAHRFGVQKIKWELEDLSFRYINPEAYYDIVEKLGMKRTEREDAIYQTIQTMTERFEELDIEATINGRPKGIYSIYRKMEEQDRPFEEIFDLIAIRVIVTTVTNCYAALGAVHKLWKPMQGRFKDYIAMPKANMYQSLHTTLVGSNGVPFEVQIRTQEMHDLAEFGIAAHWQYKEGRLVSDDLDAKMTWLRQIVNWQHDMKDSGEFMDRLKADLFADEVLVFTPKGDVIEMPAGANVIDFAYYIHSAVGHKCVGGRVNGRIVTLDTVLQTSDVVEIIMSNTSNGPRLDWLQIAKTSHALSKIRQWIKQSLKKEHVQIGKEMLEKEAKRLSVDLSVFSQEEYIRGICKRYGLSGVNDLYAAIGCSSITPLQILRRIQDGDKKNQNEEINADTPQEAAIKRQEVNLKNESKIKDNVTVLGETNISMKYAHCCSPIPGDDIIGYITRGHGISIHRSDCVNFQKDPNMEQDRIVPVVWENVKRDSKYPATISITVFDRKGMLLNVANLITASGVQVVSITTNNNRNGMVNFDLTIMVHNIDQLERIIRQLQNLADVVDAFRSNA